MKTSTTPSKTQASAKPEKAKELDFTHLPSVDSVLSRITVGQDGVLNIKGKLDGPAAAVLCEYYGEASEAGKRNGMQVLFTVYDQNGRNRDSEPVKFVSGYLSRTRAGQSVLGLRQSAFTILPALLENGVSMADALAKADFLRNVSSVLLLDDSTGKRKLAKVAKTPKAKAILAAIKSGKSKSEITAAAGRVRNTPPISLSAIVDTKATPSIDELIRRVCDKAVADNIDSATLVSHFNKVSSVKLGFQVVIVASASK